MAEPLLATAGLTKRFGGLVGASEVALAVEPGEIHAVIGPNGAGKTTLVAALAGELRPDAGTIRFAGHDISRLGPAHRAALGIVRSFQITSVFREFTALDNVALAVQAHTGHSFRFWRPAREDPLLREPARAVLAEVGLADRADVTAAALAPGENRALEVALVLATRPRLRLLDEPMAGVGPGAPAVAGYGALAHDDESGKYGLSSDEASQGKADDVATKECGSDKCKIIFRTGPRQCGAIALGESDKAWGAATRPQRASAELAAM